MRDPRRKRNISLVIALVGVIALVWGILLYDSRTDSDLVPAVGGLGMGIALLSLAYCINMQFETVRYNRLMRGEDILVEWLVDPHRWRDFLKLNEQLNSQPGNLNYPFKDSWNGELRNEGIRIVIGKAAVMIDDDFHSLPVNGFTTITGPWWFEGPPPYLEFRMSSRGKSTTFYWAVRIPAGAGDQGEARLVYDHYQSRT